MTTGKYEQVENLLKKIANENGKKLPEGTLIKQEVNVSFNSHGSDPGYSVLFAFFPFTNLPWFPCTRVDEALCKILVGGLAQ